jgi:hypothetical protein
MWGPPCCVEDAAEAEAAGAGASRQWGKCLARAECSEKKTRAASAPLSGAVADHGCVASAGGDTIAGSEYPAACGAAA